MSPSQVSHCSANGDAVVELKDSSFFTERRGSNLPRPSEVRALNLETLDPRAREFDRPPPVSIPSLRLFVKYGGDVTITEAQVQLSMRPLLEGSVPIPEVYGWAVDNNQKFVYMELVDGVALSEVWAGLGETERLRICEELRPMIQAWRSLKQQEDPPYIGSYGRQPINDILLQGRPKLLGPYQGQDAVQQLHQACQIDIGKDEPILFTHNDISPPNILVTHDPTLRVAAIVDWTQSGWYPAYWEVCKAKRVGFFSESMSDELQSEWREKYVPKIMDVVDDESHYFPWLYFTLSCI